MINRLLDQVKCRILLIWYALTKRYFFTVAVNGVDWEKSRTKGPVCLEILPTKDTKFRNIFLEVTRDTAEYLNKLYSDEKV